MNACTCPSGDGSLRWPCPVHLCSNQVTADDWAEIEANEVRLFVGEPVVGLWCPICLRSGAWKAPVQRDPSEAPGTWFTGCTESDSHPEAAS